MSRTSSSRASAWLAVLAVALVAFEGWGALAAEEAPPEPDGYRLQNYRAPVPETLAGAEVLTTAEAEALWKSKGALFVDVLPRPPKPAELPEGTVWRDKPRDSIPGAVWLPNVGFGGLNPEMEAYFVEGLERLTKGDKASPIVFFCLADCWMSWNAGKRALALGYTEVDWYPEGTDGWAEAGLPLERVEPESTP